MLLSSSHTRVRPAHESLLVSFLSSRKAHQAFLLVEAGSRARRKPGNLRKLHGFLCCSHRGSLTAPHTVGPLGKGLFKESGNATCRCSLRMNVCMMCVCGHTCHSARMEARGHVCGVGCLLPPSHEFQGLN